MAVQLVAAGAGNGTTTGAAVTEARCYTIHVHWDGVGTAPSVTPQFSVDGTNYFPIQSATASPLSQNWSGISQGFAYRLLDFPVAKIRLVVTGLSSGTISGYVSAV
jgi:hypothetical protein